jgi:hypothetical protein
MLAFLETEDPQPPVYSSINVKLLRVSGVSNGREG